MGFCTICKREHDERCDLCIYKDDPKFSCRKSLICLYCEYFNNGHFDEVYYEDYGIRKYSGYCELYETDVESSNGCGNGIFVVESEEEDG